MKKGDCEPVTAERRVYHRVPLVCDVWQRSDYAGGQEGSPSAGLAGRTLNLSDGGALISLTRLAEGVTARPRMGQPLSLTFAVPRATADTFLLEHVKVRGEVIRLVSHGQGQPPTGFAIRFSQPMPLHLD